MLDDFLIWKLQLFHPSGSCAYKSHVLDHLPENEEVQEVFIKPYKETFDYIQNKSGKAMRHPADMQDIYFIFKTENDMGLVMPNWDQRRVSGADPEHSKSSVRIPQLRPKSQADQFRFHGEEDFGRFAEKNRGGFHQENFLVFGARVDAGVHAERSGSDRAPRAPLRKRDLLRSAQIGRPVLHQSKQG
jgi:hypothetical protein